MADGPSYLPHSKKEALLWVSLVLIGAIIGRCVVVYSYHHSKRWDK